jgi:flagellar motor switch protein FliN/FliY
MTTMSRGLDLLRNVDVRVSVELGRTQMKLKDVLALGPDSVVALERLTDELLDIQVNGQTIARGEIVTIGDRFALRIVELGGEDSEGEAPAPPATGGKARGAAAR